MRIVILMKYHTLFHSLIRKDVTKFIICCSRDWRLINPLYTNGFILLV